jgi:hypothetical protein
MSESMFKKLVSNLNFSCAWLQKKTQPIQERARTNLYLEQIQDPIEFINRCKRNTDFTFSIIF